MATRARRPDRHSSTSQLPPDRSRVNPKGDSDLVKSFASAISVRDVRDLGR